jgi:protein-S-isoprenylcysteine O-methyltransferase Ste14
MSTESLPGEEALVSRGMPNAKIYDLLACTPLLVWYGICLTRQIPELAHEVATLMLPQSQSGLLPAIDALSKLAVLMFAALLIFMLVSRRPAAAKAKGIFPRVTAFFGAYLGVGILMLPRHPLNWELGALSTVLILGGMSFALWGLLWLGRSVSIMSEARRLVVGGPYMIVRHPLYLGEQMALMGVALQYISPVAFGFLVLQLVFQFYRMGFEEEILSENFPEYVEYMKRTARLVPGIY